MGGLIRSMLNWPNRETALLPTTRPFPVKLKKRATLRKLPTPTAVVRTAVMIVPMGKEKTSLESSFPIRIFWKWKRDNRKLISLLVIPLSTGKSLIPGLMIKSTPLLTPTQRRLYPTGTMRDSLRNSRNGLVLMLILTSVRRGRHAVVLWDSESN